MSDPTATHLAWLAAATERFAALVRDADLDADVAACPGWTVGDVVEHLVFIHSWVERIVETGERHKAGAAHDPPAREASRYGEWYRERADAMREKLAAVDPAGPCWNFSGVNSTYGFWPRRQTHEVTMHGVDVAIATGSAAAIDATVAADAIDEVLRVFGPRMAGRGFPAELPAPIAIEATDVSRCWTLRPPARTGDAVDVGDGSNGAAAAVLRGPASDLALALWKRIPADRIDVTGDAAVATAYLNSRLVP